MKKWLVIAGVLLAHLVWAQPVVVTPPGVLPDVAGNIPVSKSYNPISQLHAIGYSDWGGNEDNLYLPSVSTATGDTTRVLYTTKGPISQLRLFLPTRYGNTSGQEVPFLNPVFYSASVEYPLNVNSAPTQFTLNGIAQMEVGTLGSGVLTDATGINIPANTQFAIRFGTYVVGLPGAATLAGSTTGGTLAAATYYYKETCFYQNVEGGPNAETSVTTTGSTSSVSITLAALNTTYNPLGCQQYNIYRSTSTGTELYLTTINAPQRTYIDTGSLSTLAAASPPATQDWPITGYNTGGIYTSNAYCGGFAGYTVAANGVTNMATVTTSTTGGVCTTNTPILLGDDMTSPAICGLGDSIQSGLGAQANYAIYQNVDPRILDFFDLALEQTPGQYNDLNLSIPSTAISGFVGNGAIWNANLRLRATDFCSYVVSDLGSNDIYNGNVSTWQQLAGYQIQLAQVMYQRGKRYYVMTILPRGTTTDKGLAVGNFTQGTGAQETLRETYNTWVRNGMQVSGGTPVLTGGTATPYIAGYFDAAQAFGETNAGGTPTLNGGYPPFPASAYGTATVSATSSGATVTFSSPTWTVSNYQLSGYVLKDNNNGNTCAIKYNNASVFTCGASVTVTSGDTIALYQTYTADGTHPSTYGNQVIATGSVPSGAINFSTWVTQNLQGF